MIEIISSGLTDTGMVREGNEDSFFIDDLLRLYVVADGMGGHLAGEVASDIVVDVLKKNMLFFNNGAVSEDVFMADEGLSKEANMLIASIIRANDAVFEKSKTEKQYKGMGSTVSAVFFAGSNIIAANVGDSPIYLVRNGEIELLSVTHTIEAEQLAIAPEKLGSIDKKYHHMLTRAMGVSSETEPDTCEFPCYNNDILIICSDGLSNMVNAAEMVEIASLNTPEESCRKFVNLANQRGGDDNITVIVVKVIIPKKSSLLKKRLIKNLNVFKNFLKKLNKYKMEVVKKWQHLR